MYPYFCSRVFYGRQTATNHALADGPVGDELNKRLEKRLGVKIIGRWIDLGHAHLYGVGHPIRNHEDIAGLKIRVAGGKANEMRIEALGASAVTIPWPELRSHIERNEVDGLLTSHATVASDRLWEAGINSAFEDFEYFAQYVPMVRRSFWEAMPEDLQQIVLESWEQIVAPAREAAAESQESARHTLMQNGVNIVRPGPEAVSAWRERIMPFQETIVNTLGIDGAIVEKATIQLYQNE